MQELLTIGETAKEFRITEQSMRNWTKRGKIPMVRLGRRLLYRREDVDEFIRQNLKER